MNAFENVFLERNFCSFSCFCRVLSAAWIRIILDAEGLDALDDKQNTDDDEKVSFFLPKLRNIFTIFHYRFIAELKCHSKTDAKRRMKKELRNRKKKKKTWKWIMIIVRSDSEWIYFFCGTAKELLCDAKGKCVAFGGNVREGNRKAKRKHDEHSCSSWITVKSNTWMTNLHIFIVNKTLLFFENSHFAARMK